MNLSLKIKIDKLKIDFKRVASIEGEVNINDYAIGNELRLISKASDLLYKHYEEYDDVECNIENIITFNDKALFKNLAISFVADTYTTIKLIFTDGDSIELSGENGDYNKYDYSFDRLSDRIRYKNRVVSEIRTYGSLGSEEFNSITINIK